MIEIKISLDAAVNLLIERMNHEYKLRVKNNIISNSTRIDELEYAELFSLAETAVIDLIFLLPIDAIVLESNLDDIILKSFRNLARIYNREEFNYYSKQKIARLLKPIRNIESMISNEENYKYN